MTGTHVRQPDAMKDNPDPQDLHRRYVQFMRELGRERGREEFPTMKVDEFAAWLEGLDPVTRKICVTDFSMGYTAVVEEAEKQVAEVIARYE